jgi:hypothetical protein
MLQAAKDRGALKNEDVDLLSDLYDKLDESNQKLEEATLKLDAIYRSRSWKITRILRNFRSVLNF